MEEEIDRFDCENDRGDIFELVEIQEYISHAPLNGTRQKIKGLKRVETDDGSPVNYIDGKSYKLVLTGELVRRI